jgi:alkanesulfonate monooxygenase SsuD/methylene tetrahydromethanopterin reductase-like flavin-dependent oxidoreductase (luciferase family)
MEDPAAALAQAVENVGQRYVTADRSAEDIAKTLCIAGTPEDCVQAVQERMDAGVRDFNLSFLASDIEGTYQQMETFSRHVITHFRT